MGLTVNAPIWTADGPAAWPEAPTEMTVTTLRAMESCPRRWSLGAANYPELWTGRGYPPRVQLGALSGTVVHLALEVITGSLVKAGCMSLADPTALRVLKDLGGYTMVVNRCIDQALDLVASSPRAQRVWEYAARSLRAQVPELRTRVQAMLCRLRLPSVQLRSVEHGASKVRGRLSIGAFSELRLRAQELGWKGKADLLVLSDDTCEITDFKTGAPSEDHEFQIHIYALLWSRDTELNPDGRRADRLILAYSHGDVEVAAPSDADLDGLERNVAARTAAALAAVSQEPPKAKPDPQQCAYCDVRHMCSEYWAYSARQHSVEADGDRRVADAAIKIVGRHGPSSWDGVLESSAVAARGQRVLLRADSRPLPLVPGQVVRVLAAHIAETPTEANAEAVTIFTLGAMSELFLVS